MARDRHQQHQDAVRVFKGETVFDWDYEPSDQRPSSVVESTQYGALWGPSTRAPYSALEVPRPRPPRKQGGIGTVWVVTIVGFAVAVGALIGYMKAKPRARADLSVSAPKLARAGA